MFDEASDPYRDLFERSADAILIIDGETFVDCNQATVDMLRYGNKRELLQTHPSELSPDFQSDGRPSYDKASEMISIAFEKGSHRFEWEHRRADGEVFPVEVLLTAVTGGDRKLLHVVWRDITERKRLEAELRQAQKMEAIGRLSGGIAHDFNNLLVAILGHAEVLEHDPSTSGSHLDHVMEIRHAGERAAKLVRQLLAFSRKQVLQPKVLDLNEAVSDLQKILARLIGEDIQLRFEPSATVLPVLADPGQLDQVVINLATNARDAMPDGGTLTIETSSLDLHRATEAGDSELQAGSYARLIVRDTGTGILPEILPRIFDPFYTTKPHDKGTGLGLSTVYGIVKQSHGSITLESAPGQGVTATVVLPRYDGASISLAAEEEKAGPRKSLAGNEVILVVEDEEAVGKLVEHVLSRQGYTVHRARNGRVALDRVAAENLSFDLLITDVVMPELGGPALAQELRSKRPELKVLFASGYADDSLTRSSTVDAEIELISKPFLPQELLRRVREILDRG